MIILLDYLQLPPLLRCILPGGHPVLLDVRDRRHDEALVHLVVVQVAPLQRVDPPLMQLLHALGCLLGLLWSVANQSVMTTRITDVLRCSGRTWNLEYK